MVTLDASVRLRSSIVTIVELIVVVVPATWRSPAITTVPVLSPIPAGSIVNVDGPAIVLLLIVIPVPLVVVTNEVDAVKVPVKVAPTTVVSNFIKLL